MRHYVFSGLTAIVAVAGGNVAEAGSPGLLHCLAAHCRHHECNCAKGPLIIHCCPPTGSEEKSYRENKQPEYAPAPALVQASVPGFGYPGVAMMPMPIAFGMPQVYPQSYPQTENSRSQQDCSAQLKRLEDDVKQLSRDLDRVVDVVDRHSQVLDKLVGHLAERADFKELFTPPTQNGAKQSAP